MALIALAATLLVQSSSVVTSLLVVLAASGQVSLAAVLGGIVGANVGTTGTAILAYLVTGLERSALHAAVIHTGINLGMAALVLPFARQIASVVSKI